VEVVRLAQTLASIKLGNFAVVETPLNAAHWVRIACPPMVTLNLSTMDIDPIQNWSKWQNLLQ
jgi:hypothetical protein